MMPAGPLLLTVALATAASPGATGTAAEAAPSRPNILFVNIDDLRPNLGAFGQLYMSTPHLDKFSRTAVRFTRAYAVAPHCLPSRNAYMTSRRPDTSQVWSGGGMMNFRTLGPDWVTLPSFFRDSGNYTSVGQGKVFHEYGNKPAPHKPEGGWGRTDTKSWSAVGLPYFDPGPTSCKGPCSCGVNQTGDDAIVTSALRWLEIFSAGLEQQQCQIQAGQCIQDHSHILATYPDADSVSSCCAACTTSDACTSWQWWIPSAGNATAHSCRLFSASGHRVPCPAAANGSCGIAAPHPLLQPPFFLALGLHR